MSATAAAIERAYRFDKANEFLRFVAATGRQFFLQAGKKSGRQSVSQFDFDHRGALYFRDAYTEKLVDIWKVGGWPNFSNGGGLKGLIEALRDYIQEGHQLGPTLGAHWGYGETIQEVRTKAVELGIVGQD